MYKYLREEIKNLKAYDVKEREYRVKLDANEGIEWLEGLNRYPVDRSDRLRDLLAQRLNKDPDELLVGNGSSELIELAMKAYLEAGETVVSISPTFSMYRIFTIIHKGRYVDYPLQDLERLDVDGFIEFVEQSGAKLVIISNPNNPTGTLFPREDIMRIVKAVHAMVVLDEAYIEFSDLPLVDETRDNLNLVVLRTFSKAMALAGIRLGYMVGNREIIDYINRVRSPYNVNVLSQELGIKALTSDQSRVSIGMVRSERERMKRELEKRGFKPFESQTNFLFFPAKEGLDAALAKRGIMIRGFGGELEGYFRVTIGTPEENDAVLEAIEEVQNERS